MTQALGFIWPCLLFAALCGLLAGWLLWGRKKADCSQLEADLKAANDAKAKLTADLKAAVDAKTKLEADLKLGGQASADLAACNASLGAANARIASLEGQLAAAAALGAAAGAGAASLAGKPAATPVVEATTPVVEATTPMVTATDDKPSDLILIQGIGPVYERKLRVDAGIPNQAGLLEQGGTKAGRAGIAERSGIDEGLILKWVNHVDLSRLKGVGPQMAELLEGAGVDSVPELAQRDAANLAAKLDEVNAAKNLVNRVPNEPTIEDWIAEAKKNA